jgi:HEAT repeat protein
MKIKMMVFFIFFLTVGTGFAQDNQGKRIEELKKKLPTRISKEFPNIIKGLASDNFDVRLEILKDITGVDREDDKPKYQLKEGEIKPIIDEVLLEKPTKQQKKDVIEILRNCTLESIWKELVNFLDDKEKEVRISAMEAIAYQEAANAIESLVKLLGDKDDDIRISACLYLGKMKAQKAINDIVKLLEDKSAEVRGNALSALGALSAKDAVQDIVKCLSDKEPSVRLAALETIGQIQSKEAIQALEKLVTEEKNKQVLERAKQILNMLKDTEQEK